MTIHNDTHDQPDNTDHLLTAYALGELPPDSGEYRAVEERLEHDEEARAFVDEARAIARQLADTLAGGASPGLDEPQQRELATAIAGGAAAAAQPVKPSRPLMFRRPVLFAAALALAAGAAITTAVMLNQNDDTGIVQIATPHGLSEVSTAMQTPIAVDFKDARLADVIAAIQAKTGVAFDIDWKALAPRGVDRDTTVTLNSEDDMPASVVLAGVLQRCWAQSPHPDPADWTATHAGVSIAPKSALVQARLDATRDLLAQRQFSQTPYTDDQLAIAHADAWESDLWNRYLEQAKHADELRRKLLKKANQVESDDPATLGDTINTEGFDRLSETTAGVNAPRRMPASPAALTWYSAADPLATTLDTRAYYKQTGLSADKTLDNLDAGLAARGGVTADFAVTDLYSINRVLPGQVRGLSAAAGDFGGTGLVLREDSRSVTRSFAGGGEISLGLRFSDMPVTEEVLQARQERAARIDAIQLELRDFLETNQIETLDDRTSQATLEVQRLITERSELENSLKELTAQLPALQQGTAQLTDEEKNQIDLSTTITQIDSTLAALHAERELALDRFSDDHTLIQRLDQKIQEIQAERDDEFASQRSALLDARMRQAEQGVQILQAELDQGKQRLEKLQQERQNYIQAKNEFDTMMRRLNEAEAAYDASMRSDEEQAWIDAQTSADALWRQFVDQSQRDLEPFSAGDVYALVNDNPFLAVIEPGRELSTFSVDVDTAAYSLVRRQLLQQNRLPVPGAVRIEEMVNYFDYGYDAPVVDAAALEHGVVTRASLERFEKDNANFAPFATHVEVADCPWAEGHQLVRIGIQGMDVAQADRPAAHLTFLIDVSGSMNQANKLPLVKDSLKLLLEKLNPEDRVSLVVYAGASGLVLEDASAADRPAIEEALDRLSAGGSTAGAEGIRLAYEVAQRNFIEGGVNRVILCTDGDFNVGVSDTDDLVALIKQKANPPADEHGVRKGVYLSVLGYGMGNLNDEMMEPLTNAGNGNYAYIDTLEEATKVMYDQAGSTLVAIAKDVKVQVVFDASQVLAYRLIGYENRVLAAKDFDDDTVDAGDIGAGHSVTALYEVVPFILEDPGNAEDSDRVVKQLREQIHQLEEAIALNTSLLSTASLTPEQAMKLTGATRLLEQEHTLACAVAAHYAAPGRGNAKGDGRATRRPATTPPPITDKPIDGDDAEASADATLAGELPAPGVNQVPAGGELTDEDRGLLADGAMLAVKLRYKPVDAPAEDGTSRLIATRVYAEDRVAFDRADESTRFAAAVAGFGMVLRNSPHKGSADLDWVIQTADAARAFDPGSRRAQLLDLAEKARALTTKPAGQDNTR